MTGPLAIGAERDRPVHENGAGLPFLEWLLCLKLFHYESFVRPTTTFLGYIGHGDREFRPCKVLQVVERSFVCLFVHLWGGFIKFCVSSHS